MPAGVRRRHVDAVRIKSVEGKKLMRLKPALIALMLALGTAPAFAEGGNNFIVVGVGNQSCGVWIKDHSEHESDGSNTWTTITENAWLGGFITGLNASLSAATSKDVNISGSANVDAMAQWITNYCTANPLDTVAMAALALTSELIKRNRQ